MIPYLKYLWHNYQYLPGAVNLWKQACIRVPATWLQERNVQSRIVLRISLLYAWKEWKKEIRNKEINC